MATTSERSDDRLVSLLAQVIERLDRIERAIDARSFRDHADRAALEGIARAVAGETFTSADLVAHARAVPELKAALLDADIDAGEDEAGVAVGAWLRGRAGATVAGVRLERQDRGRYGVIWQFVPAS